MIVKSYYTLHIRNYKILYHNKSIFLSECFCTAWSVPLKGHNSEDSQKNDISKLNMSMSVGGR
jgi:hypothetical protein